MLSKRQRSQLDKIIKQVEKIISQADAAEARSRKIGRQSHLKSRGKSTRIRRSRTESNKMKREIKAARKRGVKVADLATKYGVSSAYIYMMK